MVVSAVTAMVAMGSGNASWASIAPPDPVLTVAAVQPAPNSVVGVAHPVVIHFVAPVTDRAAAERVITIRSDSEDRKSTRLNSSHVAISYAVFCLKKKKLRRVLSQSHIPT